MNFNCQATFENEATNYDNTLYVLPRYDEVMDGIMASMDYPKEAHIQVLELGCGTGKLIQRILTQFPNATVYAVDFSNAMLSVVQSKNGNDSRIHYINNNIFEIDENVLPYFDIVVSTFVLHNYADSTLYQTLFKKAVNLLSVNGKLLYGDLILCSDNRQQISERELQAQSMRNNHLTEEEITHWFELLDSEDSPLPIAMIKNFLLQVGFTEISVKQMGMTAIFSVVKPIDLLQVKAELLIYGIKDDQLVIDIFSRQNPDKVPKTGNNGIFLKLNEKTEILVSFLHQRNHSSPYSLKKEGEQIYLTKHNRNLAICISERSIPTWYYTEIESNSNREHFFPSYFVLEGEYYLHLAYKCCAFNIDDRCQFCSVKRRDNDSGVCQDKSAEEICDVLEIMLSNDIIPTNYHFCLGGGTYLPLEENVDFFCKIITSIRKYRSKEKGENPIWIEMIPPTKTEIQQLINAGATSFGFNVEVFDETLRHHFCPGKNRTSSIDHYIEAFNIVNNSLGRNKVGSCIIVGLDTQENIKAGVDALINHNTFPCILPLKLFDGTNMNLNNEALSLLERDFISLSQYAAEQVIKAKIDVNQNEGCMRCPCCTIIHDLL